MAEIDALAPTADPAGLAHRVRAFVEAGRAGAARPLLGALRKLAPGWVELDELSGRLLMLEDRLPEALHDIDRAVDAAPENEGVLLCRAELRLRLDDRAGAACDAADAVMRHRGSARAKAMLGAILLELDRPDDAASCLAEAMAAEPRRAAWRLALAQAQERGGDAARAARTLDAGIALIPGARELRTAAIMVAMRRRDFDAAVRIADAARADGVADACIFGLLGHALSSLSRHGAAAEAYREACKLAPEDTYVRHLVTAAGVLPQGARASADYVTAVFDGYADRFEAHLISLGYRVPGVIRAMLRDLPGATGAPPWPAGPVLDLGCGTGLMAVALSDLALGPMTGIDLSTGMLAEARRKELYQALVATDIETLLAEDGTEWSLMLAADVFCYFGDLAPVLGLAFARLAPGGCFAFSIETLADGSTARDAAPWRLGRIGRYAHAPDHVHARAIAAGFSIVRASSEILRYEADVPVAGAVFLLRKPSDAR